MAFLDQTCEILRNINLKEVEDVSLIVKGSRRVFTVGNGGGAAHASHFAADLRQQMRKEAYCVNDNVAAISAYENDHSWHWAYADWLEHSSPAKGDCLFVFSVGGGSLEVSNNICNAVGYTGYEGVKRVGIVGRNGGYLRKWGDASILIPSDSTPQVEGIQSVLAHMIACS